MKKTLLLIATVLCCAMTMFAQNNNQISYQAVVRDAENKLVANKNVTVLVNIYDGDIQDPVYTKTYTNVQTNLNGLISLLLGPAANESSDAWMQIHWNKARIETTVTLDGTQLGTLAMPLTAVPYAFYADKINPNSPMITDIYDKMQDDSTALADKMSADSTALHGALKDTARDIRGAITITNETLAALQDRVNTFNTTFCDSLKTCDVIINMRDSIKNNATAIGGKADTGKVYTRTIIDDKLALKANSAELATVATSGSYKDLADTPTNVAYTNASNIFIGDNTFSGNISASAVSFECGDNPEAIIDFCELLGTITALENRVNTLEEDKVTTNQRIDTLKNRVDSLKHLADSLAEVTESMKTDINMLAQNVPLAGKTIIIDTAQTVNTYPIELASDDLTPNPDAVIWMYINGVMVGGNHNGVIKVNNTVLGGKTFTYDATKNGDYKLRANDKVTIVYCLLPADD